MKQNKANNSICKKLFRVFCLVILTFILSANKVNAATINVDKNNGSCVNASGQGTPYLVVYCKISDAITDATALDTINVASGSYTQNLIINKNLTLQTSASASIAPTSGTGITLRSQSGTLTNVTISGFTIDAGTYGILMDGNLYAEGLTISGLTISNCIISGNSTNGIIILDGASVSNLTISGGTIQNNGWNVIFKGSTVSNTTFSNVTFGSNNSGSTLSFASGTFSNITIDGCTFGGNAWEYIDLSVAWIGVATFSDVTIKNNTFATTCGNSVWGDSSAIFTADEITLEKNIFPATSFVHNYTSNNVVALNNWWGSTTGPTVESNPGGTGATIDNNAFTFTPWCSGPFAPGTPSSTTPEEDTTPSWTWTASSTCALSLNSVPYSVGWCQNSNFTNCDTNIGTSLTNSFTIPTALSDGVWYFRVKAKDILDNESSYSSLGSTTIDTTGPTFSSISYLPSSTASTISWTTNENGSTKIQYGISTSYGNTSPETNTSPKVTSHSVVIRGLTDCSTYHYQLVSTDDHSNQGLSSDQTFTTSGCLGDSTVGSQTDKEIIAISGGSIALVSNNIGISLSIPQNASSYDLNFQIKKLDPDSVSQAVSAPASTVNPGNSNNNHIIADHVYTLTSLSGLSNVISTFDKNITINLNFSSSQLNFTDRSTLGIFRWDGSSWNKLVSTFNFDNFTATAVTDKFSTFALFGKAYDHIESEVSKENKSSAPQCTSFYPEKKPIIYSSSSSFNSATINFYYPFEARDKNNITHYSLFYTDDIKNEFKYFVDNIANQNSSTYTINFLKPNTGYYFKIKANINCAPGPYSDPVFIKTKSMSFLAPDKTDIFISPVPTLITPIIEKEEFTPSPETINIQQQPVVKTQNFWQKLIFKIKSIFIYK